MPDDYDGGRRDPDACRLRRDAVQRGPRDALVGVRRALDDSNGRLVGVPQRGEVRVEPRQAAHGHEQHKRAPRFEGREGRECAAAVAPRRDEHLSRAAGRSVCGGVEATDAVGPGESPFPCLAWFATPRCVMGMPASRGAARTDEMPGRTRGSKPCRKQQSRGHMRSRHPSSRSHRVRPLACDR